MPNFTHSSPGFGGDQSPCAAAGVEENVRRADTYFVDWLQAEIFRAVEKPEGCNLAALGVFDSARR
jgi:hypothetical protein